MTFADYHEIRVVCTDRGTHPSRELRLLRYAVDPELRDALHADVELTPREADAADRWERIVPLGDRPARRGGRVIVSTVEVGFTDGGQAEVGDQGDGRGPLWRFTCRTCRRDVPLRDDTLVRIVESLIDAGRGRVLLDISHLPATMR